MSEYEYEIMKHGKHYKHGVCHSRHGTSLHRGETDRQKLDNIQSH